MKFLTLFIFITLSYSGFADSLQGVVNYKQKQSKGVLFIFAKKFDGSVQFPLAVKKINNPTFPLTFDLSSVDKMIKSIPFKGPFKVVARLSKSGDVMDKSGPEGQTSDAITIGTKGIKIELLDK